MITDITIGQYYKGDSFVHKMDPRIKILITVLFIVMIFMCKNFLALLLTGIFLTVSIAVSKVPFRMFFKSLRPIIPIVLFTAVINIFYIGGGEELLSLGFVTVTSKGVFTALFMAVRIVLLIMSSSILTYTTVPTMLTDAIEKLLSPLKIFHIQVHTLAMMMTLALRFIPTLMEEADKIMSAQKARGADFTNGSLIQRAKALIPILIPLFSSSIRHALDLATAMECRCYRGGEGRTRMKILKCGTADIVAVISVVAFGAAVVCLNVFFA